MDIRKLQRAIVDGLEGVKAQDIVVFNTEHLSPLFERVVIASGTSNRQTKALAAGVRDEVKGIGGEILSMEGEDNGEWIIVDCGSAVVHIMQPAIRQYYHLEEIWGGKAVRMKLASQRTGLAKASEGVAEDDEAQAGVDVPARKAPARKRGSSAAEAVAKPVKPAAKRAPRAASAADGAPAARKTAPRKTTARKSTPKIQTVVINAPERKAAAPAARKRAAPKRG
ncbi:ribosome silencing factor [Sphaerotilus sulfidivorans]|jgi:ribosome-associated protein|nr:hypothetical protein CQA4T8M7_01420 [Sphaerotilus natans]